MKHMRNSYFSLGRQGVLRTMNRYVRHFFKNKLTILTARSARRGSKSTFIGITGSSAKSTTTSLLAHILEGHGNVHALEPYNTYGSIVNSAGAGKSSIDYVVAEVGVISKGDMLPMADILQPNVAIITYIGLEHFKSFRKKEAVAQEKGALVEAIQPGGFAVLNADDDHVMSMANRTSERVVTFGRERESDYRVVSVVSIHPEPLKVKIIWHGGEINIVSKLLGEHFWLSIVAAVATAIELGVSAEVITQQCATFEPISNRCQHFPTKDGPVFIVDAKKAPWESLPLAIRVVENAAAPRKRIVLGQIADYAGDAKPKYRDAYRMARAVSDQVIFFGDNAHRSKASDEDRANGQFIQLQTTKDVYEHIKNTASKGEVILLKSSNNMHLERVALAWKYDVKCWIDKCGLRIDCFKCGLYEHPFEEHEAIIQKNKAIARNKKYHRLLSRLLPLKEKK